MIARNRWGALMLIAALVCAPQAFAEESAGRADLDKATDLKTSAKSVADLEEVIKLCESALQQGLDEVDTQFAKQLLTSTLYEHAARIAEAILETSPPDRRWPLLRQAAIRDLEKAVSHDPDFGEAHMLIVKLSLLPGGDRKRAMTAADEAVRIYEDNKEQLSEALVNRGNLREEDEQRLADYDAALKANPGNSSAWQARALYYLGKGDTEKAVADFNQLLADDETNITARLALAEALSNLEKYDEALEHIEKAIQIEPEIALSHTLKARIHIEQEDLKAALVDLNAALLIQPRDVMSILLRSEVQHQMENYELALADVNRALQLRPGLPQAILLRSMIYAAQEKFGEAIADVRELAEGNPQNVELRLQEAAYFAIAERPRKAIEIVSEVLKDDPENWRALRARADYLLSIGKHKEAIADYEVAIKQQPEHDGILNNLAWVLSTSPVDELRDGKRAVELATKACEATDYKMPHILSTLGAAYAETGDFEKAIEWSTKSVELGKEKLKDQLDQLQSELDAYKEKKPFRELKETPEKEEPLVIPGNRDAA